MNRDAVFEPCAAVSHPFGEDHVLAGAGIFALVASDVATPERVASGKIAESR
jgi:hypothetical protein